MTSRNNGFLGLTVALAFVATGVLEIPASAAETSSMSSNVSAGNSLSNVPRASTGSNGPVCGLSASPTWISPGGTSTLTASCSPAATTYAWTGGTCVDTSAATCTVTPSESTAYTVAGINTGGVGAAIGVTVNVFVQASIAAGAGHTCALTTSGEVSCWGINNNGQLGTTISASQSLTPVFAVGSNSSVSAIAAGNSHNCVVTMPGVSGVGGNANVSCWGWNENLQSGGSGYNAIGHQISMVAMRGNVAAIAAGDWHSCAVTASGGVACWGNNYYGQLGDNSNIQRSTPGYVQGLASGSGVSAITAGWAHTCALLTGGGVKCWGNNSSGQLGDNSTTQYLTPVNVQGLVSGVSAIAAGAYHSCAVTASGGVKCWGDNSWGQLGDNSYTQHLTPVSVQGLADHVSAIAAGTAHTCALTTSGGVKCWGNNEYGQLGNNSNTQQLTPISVQGLDSGVSAIAAGDYHTCVWTTAGAVKCWGSNYYGQLGDNSTTDRWVPTNVSGFETIPEQTPPERVELPVDSTVAPTPGQKAVVITHGWNASVSDWVKEMANDLCANNKIGVLVSTTSPVNLDNLLSKMCQVRAPDNVLWDVWVLDWRGKAATGPDPLVDAPLAYWAAKGVGESLAKKFEGLPPYQHIHLIAHSAGANVIHTATPRLKATDAQIHATYLDAYDPWAILHPTINGRHVSTYGASANWVDSYVDTRPLVINVNGNDVINYDSSDLHLTSGYNVDVTPFIDGCDRHAPTVEGYIDANLCRHGRPYRFYGKSVDNSFTDDLWDLIGSLGATNGTGSKGFLLSLEGGGNVSVLASIKNSECRMQNDGTCQAVPSPTFGAWYYIPSAFGDKVVDSVTGTVNYVIGGSATLLFNSLNMGAGLIAGLSSSSIQPQARMSSSVRPMAQAASTTPTESPSWIVALPTTTQPVNTLRFNWRFAAAGEGFLRVFVDGNLVRELDQRHVPLASTTTEEVYIGGADGMLPAGTHRIAFRLDGFGASASGVELTNVELGLVTATVAVVAPTCTLTAEPTTIATGGASTLTASCYPSTDSYVWTGGTCDGTTEPTCTVTPTATTTYTVAGVNTAGTGAPASASVTVTVMVGVNMLTITELGTGSGTVVSSPSGIYCGTACSAVYPSGSVTLIAMADAGSTFTGWGGACSGTGLCIVNMNQAQNVAATFTSNSVTPKTAQTIGAISFTPSTLAVGDTTTASATASSGLSVSFSSTTPSTCTVSGNTVTGAVAGTCTVAGDQVGNGTYSPATQVTANITVTGSTSRLINLSTRGQVQTGSNVMIGGFVIGGSSPKKVLVRAVGPNLANYGVSGVLADPMLQLYSGQSMIASNDNWGSAVNAAEIQASTFAPVNAKEAAILSTLNPGAYTAIVSGVGGGTGVGIVEVYELDHPEIPLINISTRGRVLTGDSVLIGGFIIQGNSPQTVLIRAVGPNLANYGVPNVLANPMLQLHSGQSVIASNDDWGTAANAAAIQATGLAPMNPLESAILITLEPGPYTAIVSGANGGTGVGIIEVFAQ